MSDIYHDGSRQLQDEFDTRRLADCLDEAIVQDSIMSSDKDFIERLDMFFIATVDEGGHVNWCSARVPGWKKGEWVADTLPANDPAHDKSREVIDR